MHYTSRWRQAQQLQPPMHFISLVVNAASRGCHSHTVRFEYSSDLKVTLHSFSYYKLLREVLNVLLFFFWHRYQYQLSTVPLISHARRWPSLRITQGEFLPYVLVYSCPALSRSDCHSWFFCWFDIFLLVVCWPISSNSRVVPFLPTPIDALDRVRGEFLAHFHSSSWRQAVLFQQGLKKTRLTLLFYH